jgi:hypothetical protein
MAEASVAVLVLAVFVAVWHRERKRDEDDT